MSECASGSLSEPRSVESVCGFGYGVLDVLCVCGVCVCVWEFGVAEFSRYLIFCYKILSSVISSHRRGRENENFEE